jgi:hypothetical protein
MDRVHRWKASAFLRLNSFGAVGHHQDVIFFLLTVLGLSLSSFTSVSVLHGQTKNPASIQVSRV